MRSINIIQTSVLLSNEQRSKFALSPHKQVINCNVWSGQK
jgi:hypothetical protein